MKLVQTLLLRISSVLYWAVVGSLAIAYFPGSCLIWLVTKPFDPKLRWLHLYTCFWASSYSWINPFWRVKVLNRQNIRPEGTYVLVANHRSMIDIFVLYRLFKHFKWVSKVEVLKVPVIGWNMRLNEYVALQRGSKASIKQMMEDCEAALAKGSSIMIFPEGTRSATDELGTFRAGAFTLAKKMGVPIVPIAVKGTGQLLTRRGGLLGFRTIQVSVLPELTAQECADLTAKQLTDRVVEQIQGELGRLGSGS